MNKSLSDSDIRRYGIKNVILYEDLGKLTIPQVLSMLPLVILYQAEKEYGHWVLLHRTKDGLEFFDSLGYQPDAEFTFIKRKQPHYIAKMLYELSKSEPINYSPYVLQQDSPNISTCGRHCVVRNWFSGYGIDDYYKAIMNVCKKSGMTPDQLVTELT